MQQPIQPLNIPSWSRVKNPYHFGGCLSMDHLLITVGDSWTYGDSLGFTKVRDGIDDILYRTNHIYGKLMSDELKSQWFNLALPGCSNAYILQELDIVLANITANLTVCCITLTESGRHEELAMIDKTLPTQQLVLLDLLAKTYLQIEELQRKYPRVKFIVGHNFTDRATGIIDVCEKSWLEVMLGQTIQMNTHIVVSEHIQQMNYERRYPDVLTIIDRAQSRIDLLDNCKYCFKEDSRHPNEEGHRMWAEYLLSQI